MRVSTLIAISAAALLAVPTGALGHSADLAVEDQVAEQPLVELSDDPSLPTPTMGPLDEADLDTPAIEDEKPSLEESEQSEPDTTSPLRSEDQTLPCSGGMAGPFSCQNVDLESLVPLGPAGLGNGNDIWGWTDPETDREYAVVGSALETTFIDVTDPQSPVTLGALPTSGIPDFVLWRDVKVYGNYAFIVSEQTDHGMQVFDLTQLRDAGPLPQIFTAATVYRGADDEGLEVSNAHNIAINEETGYAYIVGSNTCVSAGAGGENGGLHMVDISDPEQPEFAGCARVTDTPSNNYSHDVQCVVYRGPDADYQGREICFSSNENVVAVIDVTNKANPTVISEWGYPEVAYTHQGWLTPDQRYFIFGDELDELDGTVDNTTTYIMDALDLDSPKRPKPFAHETRSIDHNLYIQDDLVYASNYGAGLRILQFTDSSLANGQLNEVGFFDIRPGFDEPEFVGTWSNYPFFDSGIVVMTGIEEGSTVLYVLRPTGDAAREGGGGGGQGGGGQGGGGQGGGGQGGGGQGGGGGGGSGSGSGQDGDSQPEDAAKGGALSTTGAQVLFFLLLGLALTALGTIILKLSRATRRARAPEVTVIEGLPR